MRLPEERDAQEHEQQEPLGADAAEGDNSMAASADPSAIARHTKGPWRIATEQSEADAWWAESLISPSCVVLSGEDNRPVCATNDDGIPTVTDEANAEFIVRACNSHDELVSVLKWLDRLGGLGYDKHERIRAAIAKAEGRS